MSFVKWRRIDDDDDDADDDDDELVGCECFDNRDCPEKTECQERR